jgi:hypothetical protein
MAALCVCAEIPSGSLSEPVSSPSSDSGRSPSAVFAETEYDLGLVRPDGAYEHVFRVMNVGAGDLVIKKVVVG